MTERGDETPGPRDPADGRAAEGGPAEEVGSLGEEATRLLGALSDWAREQGGAAAAPDEPDAPDVPGGPAPDAPAAGPSTGSLGAVVGRFVEAARVVAGDLGRDLDQHLGSSPPECAWCPVCRTAHLVRQTSPEVRAHLGAAGASLLQAAAGMLAGSGPAGTGSDPTRSAGTDRAAGSDQTQERPGATGPEEDRT